MSKIAAFAVMFVAFEGAVGAIIPIASDVFDDVRSTCICAIGATIGAFIGVAIFTPNGPNPEGDFRRLCVKFGCSLLGSIALTPAGMRASGVTPSPDFLMASACLCAVFVISGLHKIAPRIDTFLDWIASAKLRLK